VRESEVGGDVAVGSTEGTGGTLPTSPSVGVEPTPLDSADPLSGTRDDPDAPHRPV
jgi:hypothetical protein